MSPLGDKKVATKGGGERWRKTVAKNGDRKTVANEGGEKKVTSTGGE